MTTGQASTTTQSAAGRWWALSPDEVAGRLGVIREQYLRPATLPFDPTYKLMATFNAATDSSGRKVVRCFVKGAAPAVMGRAATALTAGGSVHGTPT